MKKKSERLTVVLALAERKERAAMEVLAGKRNYRDQQQTQLDSLKSYHTQYVDDLKQNMTGTVDVNHLQANLLFMNQIDAAIQQQEGITKIAQDEFNHALKIWTDFHQKTKGMSDLVDRYRNEEFQAVEKKQQKQIEDDLSARRYRR